jgi:hypothetical protein
MDIYNVCVCVCLFLCKFCGCLFVFLYVLSVCEWFHVHGWEGGVKEAK